MKKLISMLLAIIISMASVSAFAEATVVDGEFSVRNGIKFGMTVDEVASVEKENGNTAAYKIMDMDTPVEPLNWIRYDGCVNIASVEMSTLDYLFTGDGSLKGISYSLGNADYNRIDAYPMIQESLCAKYGEPALVGLDSVLMDTSSYSLIDEVESMEIFKMLGMKWEVTDINQWLIKYPEYYVVIDVFKSDWMCHVGYRMFTFEEYEAVINQAGEEAAALESQINGDL